MSSRKWVLALALGWLLGIQGAAVGGQPAQEAESGKSEPKAIGQATEGLDLMSGYFDLYWDERAGTLWLEIDRFEEPFLYVSSLSAGIGSNDIGLDRGQMGHNGIVEFRRVGPRVLLVQPNFLYRAETDNEFEKRAVEEAFAESVLWGFEVEAETGSRVLVDATDFVLRDSHRVSRRLAQSNQGNYKLEGSRSAVFLDNTRSFPRNTEMEATLTFVGDPEGAWIRSVTPSPDAVTVRQHHSFVQLPDPGFEVREWDTRSSFIPTQFYDYGTGIAEPLVKRYVTRHRLAKKDPSAASSEAVEPIVYYLDRGTPEPIRSALLDGARWWNQAFEAAGYEDAFQVEMLPEDADPMDLRYNLIQWVHRSTRGWSYGNSIVDPRTGEIIKGKVTLGSLRVRQDFLIAEGLLAPYGDDGIVPEAMEQMALARLRQLSAHEVGHTIGLMHNYSSSGEGRASVMDYPHPLVEVESDGSLTLDNAYASGIGAWDRVAVTWGYQDFREGADEQEELEVILADARKRGLSFITDQDARPAGSAHPRSHLWDNGVDPVAELERILDVRAAALANFGERNIRIGTPMSMIEDALVPIYLLHRYQIEAAAKVVGGQDYTYAVRGDGQVPTSFVPPEHQRRALEALLRTIEPSTLTLAESLIEKIPPRSSGLQRGRENFPSRTAMTFDPVSAAEVAAEMTVSFLLHPDRASRLVVNHARNEAQPSLEEVLQALTRTTLYEPAGPGLEGEVERAVDAVVLRHLMALAVSDSASAHARAAALAELESFGRETGDDSVERAHRRNLGWQISRFLDDPQAIDLPEPLRTPDGSPIGSNLESLGGSTASWCSWLPSP